MKKTTIFLILVLSFPFLAQGRSPFRKKDPDSPEITIGWKNSKRVLRRFNRTYTEYPLFTAFNENFFFDHLLPAEVILSRNNETPINCNHLNNLIHKLLVEIKRRKKSYTDFEIIRDRNFNHKQQCGLLILRFKQYPFVLKLFMETPKSFIDPYCKGFENQFFFYMSGGMNRHIAGLTRIKNLEVVLDQIKEHPRWKDIIITPRKWYWLPHKPRWIEIKGRNIGNSKSITTEIPSVYAIIADELDVKENVHTLSSQAKSELIMELCMDLHLFVDPHADNFIIKHRPITDDYSISIVDTEHFPSMVGLKEEPFFNNHVEWYIYLAAKFFQDAFLQTKNSRKKAQNKFNPCELRW